MSTDVFQPPVSTIPTEVIDQPETAEERAERVPRGVRLAEAEEEGYRKALRSCAVGLYQALTLAASPTGLKDLALSWFVRAEGE